MVRPASHRSRPIVLLVQPERDDREMYAEFLLHKGMTPICPPTAMDALSLAPKSDVIVTALLLPGSVDGIEFICRLRSDERTRSIPVAVLTACAWNSERERAALAGCDVFLSKPCLPSDLLRELRRLLLDAKPLTVRGVALKAELSGNGRLRRMGG